MNWRKHKKVDEDILRVWHCTVMLFADKVYGLSSFENSHSSVRRGQAGGDSSTDKVLIVAIQLACFLFVELS